MITPDFPTPWQKKTIWAALTTLSVVAIGSVAVGLIWVMSQVLGFLQPILIPFAVAAVLAYLLDPLVTRISSWGTSRQRAVFAVFAVLMLLVAGILLWVIPALTTQTGNLARKVPHYTEQVKTMVIDFAHNMQQKYGIKLLPEVQSEQYGPPAPPHILEQTPAPPVPKTTPPATPVPAGAKDATTVPATTPADASAKPASVDPVAETQYDFQQLLSGDWVRTTLPAVVRNTWRFIITSVGGFLGVFGFLLSMVIVPIYLYYFLIESRNISRSWGNYLPLRASAFKDEVVSALEEINGYLIAFFRGQLVVSLINGTATGLGLVIVGLDFGLLIGLMLCFLGIIPYLGIILCWIPAVIIASVQGGAGTWVPGDPWWVFPLVVTAIFTIVQQVDGLFITPKIVGESVGLHPMTVIVSVFVWSLLMGGLLGAILAVPMTATLKVLLRRYIWERRRRVEENAALTEESFAVQNALGAASKTALPPGK
jgi:predicted PurR-regulated permease PerM